MGSWYVEFFGIVIAAVFAYDINNLYQNIKKGEKLFWSIFYTIFMLSLFIYNMIDYASTVGK